MPKLKDFERLSKKEYQSVNPEWVLKNSDIFRKGIRDFLKTASLKALKPKAGPKILRLEIFFGYSLDGSPYDSERTVEYAIKKTYLQELVDDDAINEFSIETGNDDVMMAKIALSPKRFLDTIENIKKRKFPKFLCENGKCFLDFGKNNKAEIGGRKSDSCRLLELFCKEKVNGRTIQSVYDFLKDGKKPRKNTHNLINPFDREKNAKLVIENSIREIRRRLAKAKLRKKIRCKFQTGTAWIEFAV